MDDLEEAPISELTKKCPSLLQNYDTQLECVQLLLSRMAMCGEDDTDELTALLRLLCYHCPPNSAAVEGLLNIVVCLSQPAPFLDAIPQMCSNTPAEVELIMEAYQNLLLTDRTLLLPVLGSLSCLTLPPQVRTQVFQMAEESLSMHIVTEADIPAVIRSLLCTMDMDNPERAISLIRTETQTLSPATLILILDVLEQISRTSVDIMTHFLKELEKTPKLLPIDMLVLLLLMNHRRKQQYARAAFLHGILTGRVTESSLYYMFSGEWAGLLQSYSAAVLTCCELFLQPETMLSFAFSLTETQALERVGSEFATLDSALHVRCPLDWTVGLITVVYEHFSYCRAPLLRALLSACSHAVADTDTKDSYLIGPLAYPADVASACVSALALSHTRLLMSGRALLEEAVYFNSKFHPVVASRLCCAMARMGAMEPNLQQSMMVPIQKHLASCRWEARIAGLALAGHMFKSAHMNEASWSTIVGWLLRMISTIAGPANDSSATSQLAYVFDYLRYIADTCPTKQRQIILTKCLIPVIIHALGLLRVSAKLQSLVPPSARKGDSDDELVTSHKKKGNRDRVAKSDIPDCYIYDGQDATSAGDGTQVVYAVSTSTVQASVGFVYNSRVVDAAWACYVQHAQFYHHSSAGDVKYSSSSSSSSSSSRAPQLSSAMTTADMSNVLLSYFSMNDILCAGFELPFDTKRLEQLLFAADTLGVIVLSPTDALSDFEDFLSNRLRSLTNEKLESIVSAVQLAYGICVGSLKGINEMNNVSESVERRLHTALRLHRLQLLGCTARCMRQTSKSAIPRNVSVTLSEMPPGMLLQALQCEELSFALFQDVALTPNYWQSTVAPRIDSLHHILRLLSRHLYDDSGQAHCIGSFSVGDVLGVNGIPSTITTRLEPVQQLIKSLATSNVLVHLLEKITNLHHLVPVFMRTFPGHCPGTWNSKSTPPACFVLSGGLKHVWALLLDSVHFLLYLLRGTMFHVQLASRRQSFSAAVEGKGEANDDDMTMTELVALLCTVSHAKQRDQVQKEQVLTAEENSQEDLKKKNLSNLYGFFTKEARQCDNFTLTMQYIHLCMQLAHGKPKVRSVGVLCFQLLYSIFPYTSLPSHSEPQPVWAESMSLNFLTSATHTTLLVDLRDVPARSGLLSNEEMRATAALLDAFTRMRMTVQKICHRHESKQDAGQASSVQIQVLWWTMLAFAPTKHWHKFLTAISTRLTLFGTQVVGTRDNVQLEKDDQLKNLTVWTAPLFFELVLSSTVLYLAQLSHTEALSPLIAVVNTLVQNYLTCIHSDHQAPYVRHVSSRKHVDLVKPTLVTCLKVVFPLLQYRLSAALAYFHETSVPSAAFPMELTRSFGLCARLVTLTQQLLNVFKVSEQRSTTKTSLVPRIVSRMEGFRSFLEEIERTYHVSALASNASVNGDTSNDSIENDAKMHVTTVSQKKKNKNTKRKTIEPTVVTSEVKEEVHMVQVQKRPRIVAPIESKEDDDDNDSMEDEDEEDEDKHAERALDALTTRATKPALFRFSASVDATEQRMSDDDGDDSGMEGFVMEEL